MITITITFPFSFSPTASLTATGAYEDTGNPVSTTGPTGVSTFAYDAATHGFAITASRLLPIAVSHCCLLLTWRLSTRPQRQQDTLVGSRPI